ncbi:unnamed protein product, partial [Prorocentrum cordatum]
MSTAMILRTSAICKTAVNAYQDFTRKRVEKPGEDIGAPSFHFFTRLVIMLEKGLPHDAADWVREMLFRPTYGKPGRDAENRDGDNVVGLKLMNPAELPTAMLTMKGWGGGGGGGGGWNPQEVTLFVSGVPVGVQRRELLHIFRQYAGFSHMRQVDREDHCLVFVSFATQAQ